MFQITNILNPLTGGATTQEYVWEKGKPLSAYFGYDGDCLVACGGAMLDKALDTIFPARGERYVVVPIPEGGDKQSYRILGYTAMTAVSFIPGWGPAASFVGANLINLFLRDKDKEDIATSQSYSWQHVASLTASHNTGMPVIYGKVRARPIIKNRYVTVEGDKQRLYALYGLAAHKVDERVVSEWSGNPARNPYVIGDEVTPFSLPVPEPGKTYMCKKDCAKAGHVPPYTDVNYWKTGHGTAAFAIGGVVINGRAIEDYHDDVDWDTRPGLAEQEFIDGFNVTYTNYSIDQALHINRPEVSMKTATFYIHYPAGGFEYFRWKDHTLIYRDQSYAIPAGKSAGFHVTDVNGVYVVWDSDDRETYTVLFSTPTTPHRALTDTEYLIYSASVSELFGLANPYYYYTTNYPTDASDWYYPRIDFNDVHNIEVFFHFPYGLYGIKDGETMVSATTRIFAQYRVKDSGTWTNFNFRKMITKADYERADYADHTITSGNIVRNNQEQFDITYKAVAESTYLDTDSTYEIRVSAGSPVSVHAINIAGILYGEGTGFTYPGEPLLGIKALASGQISGDLDVQVDVERSKVWVYDTRLTPNAWVQVDANNHAWAVYDILVNGFYHTASARIHPAYPDMNMDGYTWIADGVRYTAEAEAIYGCGIDPERIDFESFHEWAQNVYDIGYELNIIFDTFMTAWDAILRICQEGRGMVYPVGTKIYAFTDKAEAVSQVFTVGNIQVGTFVQKYLEAKNKANMIEATYYDEDNNYEKTTLAARTSNWDSSTDLNEPVAVTLYGTTAFEQAWSIASFLLISNELLNNIITFGVDIDTLAAQVGEVVEVQHDVLMSGYGGRVVSYVAGTKTVTLDKSVFTVPGTIYELTITHSNGITERVNVTVTVPTDTPNVYAPGFVYAPATYDVYSFGVKGVHTSKYRITNISRTSELMRALTLVQYDEAVYETIPFNVAKTAVGPVANLLNLASNLRLQEVLSKNRVTGEYESSIVAVWDTVSGDPRGAWEVVFRDVDASDNDWEGTWEQGTYGLGDKVEKDGITYISIEDDNVSTPFSI